MTPENKPIVVIFEDNASISQLLKFFFQKRGYEPMTFQDGMDAAKHVREHAPVLIMMDMIMPIRQAGWQVSFAILAVASR